MMTDTQPKTELTSPSQRERFYKVDNEPFVPSAGMNNYILQSKLPVSQAFKEHVINVGTWATMLKIVHQVKDCVIIVKSQVMNHLNVQMIEVPNPNNVIFAKKLAIFNLIVQSTEHLKNTISRNVWKWLTWCIIPYWTRL